MPHLTRNDYAAVLGLLARLEQLAGDPRRWMEAALESVTGFVACERASLTVSDLGSGEAPSSSPGSYVASVPLSMEGCRLVRIELRRSHRDFSDRDRARLTLLQPHLAYLYRQCRSWDPPASLTATPGWPVKGAVTTLTPREADVMQWLACGKTDTDIAALLAISPRTVHKHLEHIYEKLGVETRTAAVMALRRRTELNV